MPLESEAICTRTTSRHEISQTESYLERARNRLIAHDTARQTFVTDIEQSEGHSLQGLQTSMERPRVRQRLSHAHQSGVIPPLPTLILWDFSDWMQERHGDLQEAMNVGTVGRSSVDINVVERCRDRKSDNNIMNEDRT